MRRGLKGLWRFDVFLSVKQVSTGSSQSAGNNSRMLLLGNSNVETITRNC